MSSALDQCMHRVWGSMGRPYTRVSATRMYGEDGEVNGTAVGLEAGLTEEEELAGLAGTEQVEEVWASALLPDAMVRSVSIVDGEWSMEELEKQSRQRKARCLIAALTTVGKLR